jgi:hypothetical protein
MTHMNSKKLTNVLSSETVIPGIAEQITAALRDGSCPLPQRASQFTESTQPILDEIVSRYNGMTIHFPSEGREDNLFQEPPDSLVGVNVNLHYSPNPSETGIAIGFHVPFIHRDTKIVEFTLDKLECSLVNNLGERITDDFFIPGFPKTVCRFWAPTDNQYRLEIKLKN